MSSEDINPPPARSGNKTPNDSRSTNNADNDPEISSQVLVLRDTNADYGYPFDHSHSHSPPHQRIPLATPERDAVGDSINNTMMNARAAVQRQHATTVNAYFNTLIPAGSAVPAGINTSHTHDNHSTNNDYSRNDYNKSDALGVDKCPSKNSVLSFLRPRNGNQCYTSDRRGAEAGEVAMDNNRTVVNPHTFRERPHEGYGIDDGGNDWMEPRFITSEAYQHRQMQDAGRGTDLGPSNSENRYQQPSLYTSSMHDSRPATESSDIADPDRQLVPISDGFEWPGPSNVPRRFDYGMDIQRSVGHTSNPIWVDQASHNALSSGLSRGSTRQQGTEAGHVGDMQYPEQPPVALRYFQQTKNPSVNRFNQPLLSNRRFGPNTSVERYPDSVGQTFTYNRLHQMMTNAFPPQVSPYLPVIGIARGQRNTRYPHGSGLRQQSTRGRGNSLPIQPVHTLSSEPSRTPIRRERGRSRGHIRTRAHGGRSNSELAGRKPSQPPVRTADSLAMQAQLQAAHARNEADPVVAREEAAEAARRAETATQIAEMNQRTARYDRRRKGNRKCDRKYHVENEEDGEVDN